MSFGKTLKYKQNVVLYRDAIGTSSGIQPIHGNVQHTALVTRLQSKMDYMTAPGRTSMDRFVTPDVRKVT